MNHVEKARELFLNGYNCAQSIFAAFSDVTGIDVETSLRLSSSFGGGMGRLREVCGSVSGMFMVVGVLYGYDTANDNTAKKEHYDLIQRMAREFREKHDTIICRELLASLKPDCSPAPTIRNAEYYKTRPCLRFIETAAEITDRIIEEKSNDK